MRGRNDRPAKQLEFDKIMTGKMKEILTKKTKNKKNTKNEKENEK